VKDVGDVQAGWSVCGEGQGVASRIIALILPYAPPSPASVRRRRAKRNG
jgi:hypothetical protein